MGTLWRTVKIGGGGYCTGIDIAPDGTIVTRTDTFGGYIWNAATGEWDQLIKYRMMEEATRVAAGGGRGIHELRIAPSDSSRLWMMYYGGVFRSDYRGGPWIDTSRNYATLSASTQANDTARYMGQKMAVHPTDPDFVIMGTPNAGLWITDDAGATWTQVADADVPFCTTTFSGVPPGHPGICFDGNGNIYAPSYGEGVYFSDDLGATWALLSGGPTTVRHAKIGPDDNYYTVSVTGGAVHKWNGSAWSTITPSGITDTESIVCDPSDANRIIAVSAGSTLRLSTNQGSSWGSAISTVRASPDIPWLAWTNEVFMSLGDVLFDNDGNLWNAHGIGVAVAPFSGSPSSVTWTYQTKGIENLTCNGVVIPPNGKPLLFGWDRSVFRVEDPTQYSSYHSPDRSFTAADVNVTDNTITIPDHGFTSNLSGRLFAYPDSTLPSPFTTFPTAYFVEVVDADTIKFSASSGPGAAVNITTQGTGTSWFIQRQIRMAWDCDYATSDPDFVAYPAFYDGNAPEWGWYSADGGAANTWRPFASGVPAGGNIPLNPVGSADKTGGCIAISTPLNMIIVPSNDALPWYTKDGGATWDEIDLGIRSVAFDGQSANFVVDEVVTGGTSGATGTVESQSDGGATGTIIFKNATGNFVNNETMTGSIAGAAVVNTTQPETGFGNAYFNHYVCVAADRVTTGVFYLYNYVTRRVYRSTDQGDTWTQMNAAQLPSTMINQCRLKAVPGNEGHLFLTGGGVGSAGDANPGNTRFYRSTDAGATWTEVTAGGALREVSGFGFGAAAPGESYPAIAVVGWLNSVYGAWESSDNCATWRALGANPADWLTLYRDIDGDKETYGTWYAALNGASFVYREEAFPNRMVPHRLHWNQAAE